MVYKSERKNRKSSSSSDHEPTLTFVDQYENVPIYEDLDRNLDLLKKMFRECSDIVIRTFELCGGERMLMLFVDGLVNSDMVDDAMNAMMACNRKDFMDGQLRSAAIPVSQIQENDNYKSMLLGVLGGDTALFMDGAAKVINLGIRGGNMRSVSEPETETTVRGPREGFVENIRTNTSMLRRKLKTPELKMKPLKIGKRTNTDIVISYMEHLTDPKLVEEVLRRLQKIDIDGILESGYIEALIQDSNYSPFPQVQYTERPDTVAANLLEGRIAIFTDGTPLVLLVPVTFWMMLQASEDYYERVPIAILIRWLRYIFLIVSLLTPALYVAITTFHQALIPTKLLLSVAASREAIPFPAIVEALIMEVTFEALREAGIRLPKTVGQAVSILGALVVGTAAVDAGIVSAPMVIVVSITGIASFTLPKFNGAIAVRMLRFPIMIAASMFGIYGIIMSMLLIIGHMVSLRSIGIPYLSPVAPLHYGDLSDVFLRKPFWAARFRPSFIPMQDRVKQGPDLPREIMNQGGQKSSNVSHEEDEA